MNPETNELETLARAVAREMGDGCADERLLRHRRAWLTEVGKPSRSAWVVTGTSFAAVAALGLILVGVWLAFAGTRGRLPFEVGPLGAAGGEGQWLAASAGQALPLRFSDGSELALGGPARARVVESTERSVLLVLQEGRLEASIRHSQTRGWTVQAGPYRIRDLGTRFALRWDSASSVLEVFVSEGEVQVAGPWLGAKGIVVSANERLSIDGLGRPSRAVLTEPVGAREGEGRSPALAPRPEPDPPAEERPASAPSKMHRNGHKRRGAAAEPSAPEPPPGEPEGSARPQARRTPLPGLGSLPGECRALFEQGRYAEVLAFAHKAGFAHWLQDLDFPDLWRLGEAARYAKQSKEAQQVLQVVRQRFSTSWRARVAAFLLGRLAMEQGADPATAVGWFRTYLKEEPDGSLAQEALGRLISAEDRLGHKAEAQATARAYLQRYPNGLFAALARSVLE